SFKDHNFGAEFFGSGDRLLQSFGLADDADIVLNGKDLAQPGAKNCLRVGHDDPDKLLAVLHGWRGQRRFSRAHCWACHQFIRPYRCSKRYSSITTPTPRRSPSCETRATRPMHCTFTSSSAPTTSAGNEMVNSIFDPTGISTS